MKMSRSILRRLELKIYHAIVADQMKKSSLIDPAQKQNPNKTQGDDPLLSK
jgi:hypothetical protein